MRLDLYLVELGLARSRNHAAQLIEAERVVVSGRPARKASQPVVEGAEVTVLEAIDYVSRAGHKLAGALDHFASIVIQDKTCMDVGASTGGFTEVLLRRGAKRVVAIDVGHNQLVPELATNKKVLSIEGFNARELSAETLKAKGFDVSNNPIELVVADLSFISLTLVLEAIKSVAPNADCVLLIKPQFEVGKQSLSANGIVNDHRLRAQAIHQVVDHATELGYGICGLEKSELVGTHGNIEYLLWISPAAARNQQEWDARIDSLAREKV